MKQYTTPEQTAKLIELGFEKPTMAPPILKWVNGEPTFEPQYTIGELIEMLPKYINIWDTRDINTKEKIWNVGFMFGATTSSIDLIDALYNMIVKLKEDKLI